MTTHNEIKIYEPTEGHISDLYERCRAAINRDLAFVEISPDDLLWLLQHAAPVQKGVAIVFWDGLGYFWTPDGKKRVGPFGSAVGLDDAITDAKLAGYKIYEVNRTRGDMPAVNPQPPTGAPRE